MRLFSLFSLALLACTQMDYEPLPPSADQADDVLRDRTEIDWNIADEVELICDLDLADDRCFDGVTRWDVNGPYRRVTSRVLAADREAGTISLEVPDVRVIARADQPIWLSPLPTENTALSWPAAMVSWRAYGQGDSWKDILPAEGMDWEDLSLDPQAGTVSGTEIRCVMAAPDNIDCDRREVQGREIPGLVAFAESGATWIEYRVLPFPLYDKDWIVKDDFDLGRYDYSIRAWYSPWARDELK